jgi:hypothetical protein
MKMSDQIMCASCCYTLAAAKRSRGQLLVDAVEAAIREDSDNIAGRELRRNCAHDGVRVGEKLGGCVCGVEGADDFLGVQALSLGNALLLIDGGENGSIGEAETRN